MIVQFKKEEEELEKQVEASSGQTVTATSSTAAKIDSSAKAGDPGSSLGTANDVLDVEGIQSASLVSPERTAPHAVFLFIMTALITKKIVLISICP